MFSFRASAEARHVSSHCTLQSGVALTCWHSATTMYSAFSVRQRSIAPPQAACSLHCTSPHSSFTLLLHAAARRALSLHRESQYSQNGCSMLFALYVPIGLRLLLHAAASRALSLQQRHKSLVLLPRIELSMHDCVASTPNPRAAALQLAPASGYDRTSGQNLARLASRLLMMKCD